MNREIKFRGKDINNNNSWAYGSLIEIVNPHSYQILGACNDYYDVDEDTIGQYTDMQEYKGADIYEGDIVRTLRKEIGVVEWNKCACAFVLRFAKFSNNINDYDYLSNYAELEVIGNIYDNKELLN